MIISRTPLRVSLFGGGTDLPEFYEEYGGAILSFSINKYVYVTSHNSFEESHRFAYSEVELVKNLHETKNPIIRECLHASNTKQFLEITTVADVPSKGTGLASSSAFAVGLLNVLSALNNDNVSQLELAEKAFEIERFRVGDPVGKQDHYGTAIGGFKFLEIEKSGKVLVNPIGVSDDLIRGFFSNLLIVYTGVTRSAKTLLLEQQKTLKLKKEISNYGDALAFAKESFLQVMKGNYDEVGKLLAAAWHSKKNSYNGVSTPFIDQIISTGIDSGAAGAKLLGAGGGGFVLFYAPSELHTDILSKLPTVRQLPFQVDTMGTQILFKELYD